MHNETLIAKDNRLPQIGQPGKGIEPYEGMHNPPSSLRFVSSPGKESVGLAWEEKAGTGGLAFLMGGGSMASFGFSSSSEAGLASSAGCSELTATVSGVFCAWTGESSSVLRAVISSAAWEGAGLAEFDAMTGRERNR